MVWGTARKRGNQRRIGATQRKINKQRTARERDKKIKKKKTTKNQPNKRLPHKDLADGGKDGPIGKASTF